MEKKIEDTFIGYVKYEGKLVDDGLMDGRRQAHILLSLDDALRYFIVKQVPDLQKLDFEIPIRVRKGSWQALIPETVAGWAQAGLGIAATAYMAKAAQKMADKDFADIGFTDLFKKSLEAIKWFAKIGKHMGDLTIRSFTEVKFSDDNTLVGIRNTRGEYLFVPKEYLELYSASNPKLLEGLVQNVEEGRTLAIGTVSGNEFDQVVIELADKEIFCGDEGNNEEESLFPELAHGDRVVLDGEVTRENKTSNSMGFKYRGHILTAYPTTGSIVPFKNRLFLLCRLRGTVSRADERGGISARRPRLFFDVLETLESENTRDLFES